MAQVIIDELTHSISRLRNQPYQTNTNCQYTSKTEADISGVFTDLLADQFIQGNKDSYKSIADTEAYPFALSTQSLPLLKQTTQTNRNKSKRKQHQQ